MASKKVPSVEDAVKTFKDVMTRASLENFLYVNKTLISQFSNSKKEFYVLILPQQELWNKLIEDPELNIKELDVTNKDQYNLLQKILYADDITDEAWIELDSEKFYKGQIINIRPEGFEYDIPINKDLLPFKLRKAEYNNISYKIFIKNNSFVIALKKYFEPKLDECGFNIIRLFQII